MELVKIDINHLDSLKKDSCIATIGQFDGLHVAHLELIKKTIMLAKNNSVKSAVISFDIHPDFVLHKTNKPQYVTLFSEKVEMLKLLGVDTLYIINFNNEFSKMDPNDFVTNILLRIGVTEIVVGFDFRFGCFGSGKAEDIEKLSYGKIKTHIIKKITYEGEKISTTLIKSLLEKGNVKKVEQIMGRYYKITGKVVHGNEVGKKIGLPTANVMIEDGYYRFMPGVYVVRVKIDDRKYLGIANFGINPSFNVVDKLSFEVHIFDFENDIYGKSIDVELIEFIRNDIKFNSVDSFLERICKDKEFAKHIEKTYDLRK